MLGALLYWECVRTSRRGSRWLVRMGYFAVLSGLLSVGLVGLTEGSEQEATVQAIRNCFSDVHLALASCQLIAAVLLGPVYAAGSLMEERVGRTLQLVLASRAMAAQFITGKLCAALVRVVDVLFAGLPMFVICGVLGRVPPETVVAELALTISAASTASALALLIALWCRRLVDSLVLTYLVQGFWYGLPVLNVLGLIVGSWATVPEPLQRLNALRATSDLATVPPSLWWSTWLMPALAALAFGLACWFAAILSLRVASCSIEFGGDDRDRLKAARRLGFAFARRDRPVGDRPLLWRELHCRRITLVERLTWALFVVAGVVVLGLIVREWSPSVRALASQTPGGPPPRVCIIAGAATFCHLSFLAFPFLAVAGATGLADERDGMMVELLQLTDLEQIELVHAKLARLAKLGLILLVPPALLAGIVRAIGYSNWSSVALVCLHCAAAFAFAATFGLAIGLRSSKTNTAVAATIAFGLLGGFLIPFLCALSIRNEPTLAHYVWATLSPPLQCFFLMMFDTAVVDPTFTETISTRAMYAVALGWTLAYALASFGLYVSCTLGKNLGSTPHSQPPSLARGEILEGE
jgi:hypothetical protein